MKQNLIDKICIFLLKKGFIVKNLKSNCFDILGRKGTNILLLKILEDANSITREYANNMNSISVYINATPLIISEKAGQMLEDNIVYQRFGIHTINLHTLSNCIDNKFPFIKRSHAGLIASVIGRKMKEKREELGISQNAMSKILGVTGRMVSKYESGSSEVTLQKAIKIYDVFGQNVFYKLNIFKTEEEPLSNASTDYSQKYVEIGFEATDTTKTPFDIIAKKDNHIIITEIGDNPNPDSQALSRLIDAQNLVIFENKRPRDIKSIKRKEFLEFEQADELLKYLKEF